MKYVWICQNSALFLMTYVWICQNSAKTCRVKIFYEADYTIWMCQKVLLDRFMNGRYSCNIDVFGVDIYSALTLPTSGGRSVSIVRLFVLFLFIQSVSCWKHLRDVNWEGGVPLFAHMAYPAGSMWRRSCQYHLLLPWVSVRSCCSAETNFQLFPHSYAISPGCFTRCQLVIPLFDVMSIC
jgi:hypothetical protein